MTVQTAVYVLFHILNAPPDFFGSRNGVKNGLASKIKWFLPRFLLKLEEIILRKGRKSTNLELT